MPPFQIQNDGFPYGIAPPSRTFKQMGAMIGTFTRIQRNSSTDELAMLSITEKIQELQTLQYTHAQCAKAIRCLANKHNTHPLWSKCFYNITGIKLDGPANDAYHLNP